MISDIWPAVAWRVVRGALAAPAMHSNGMHAAGYQFGFQGPWTSNDTSPTSFALNGTACT